VDAKIAKLNEMVLQSDNIVFFGGAGVSTESGIPDFRSTGGLYSQTYKYPPEMIVSHTFYEECPEEFFDFYKKRMLFMNAQPNAAHKKLAQLEKAGKLKAVITQNIDGLHQAAGSKNVLELHGSVLRNYCESCGKSFPVKYVLEADGVPHCDACGGRVKPDVVLYEENLDMDVMEAAVNYISRADMLIIGGTSLVVYPAAGLLRYYQGHKLVLVNKSNTSYDSRADLVINENIGEVFSQIQGPYLDKAASE
jgi:NAD-dependent protein deacetylases, SIR2 family